jgi:hypothetical protein
MSSKKDQLALDIIARNASMKSDRSTWDTQWQQIADYVMPRKSSINTIKTPGTEGYTDDLYNLQAVHGNQVLAAGQIDYLMSGDWFAYSTESDNDDVKRYFQNATEIMKRKFAESNLYLEAHEMFLDRGAFGTASLFMKKGKKTLLNFKKFDVGTYCIAEDGDGDVDTFFREFEMTCRNAYKEFGDKAGKEVCEAMKSDKPTDMDKKLTFIHAIYPREDGERKNQEGSKKKKIDGPNKPWASVTVCVKDQCTCRNEGFDDFPLAVTRFLTWNDAVYGYSPSFEALPTVRQVNFIEQQMDTIAEIKATPRVLVPDSLAGDIDMRAGGVTEFDPNAPNSAMPKEWATKGEYDIGLERIESKNKMIDEAYHVDLFQLLKSLDDKERTAYEISQRLAEKVAMFSPTFRRSEKEVFIPVLTWSFREAYDANLFGEPPEAALENGVLRMPEIRLTSKLAMAIKAAENNAFAQLINILLPLAEVNPAILDNYDMDKAARGLGKNLSVPTAWERPLADVEEIRASREKAQEAAAAAEQAPQMAKAAKDVSQASPSVRRALVGRN